MKAITLLMVAAGVASAATLPVHPGSHSLAARQDVSAAVIDPELDAESADAEVNAAEAENLNVEADAEAEDAEAADAEEEAAAAEEEAAADEEVDNVDLAVDLNAIGDLDLNQLLGLNLNDAIDFDILGLDANLLALGVNNLFGGFFPGIFDINDLALLNAGQLLELMIFGQALFNLGSFNFISQQQIVQIIGNGFVNNILPFGFAGAVPVNFAALGVFGGFNGVNGVNGGFFKRETPSTE